MIAAQEKPRRALTRRAQQRRKTHTRLVNSALRRFSKKGIAATRTVDVARAARVSHGAIFVHFPTRDDLVTAAVEKFGKQVTRRLHDLVDRNASVAEVLAAHLAGLQEHESFYARLLMEGPLLPPVARSTLIGIQSAIAFHLSAAAEREMKAGKIQRTSLPLLFNTWIGLLHHYLSNQDLFAPGESVLGRHGQDLLDHFMGLLAPRRGGLR